MKQMPKGEGGFTLIELMIVIAIIGILAALAVPGYQDYTKRTKVGEGLELSKPAKTAVGEFYQAKARLPDSNTSVGMPHPASIVGNYVTSVTVANSGEITIQYQGVGDSAIDGHVVTMSPITSAGTVRWNCTAGSAATTPTDIPPRFLPPECR